MKSFFAIPVSYTHLHEKMKKEVYIMPDEVNQRIAELKLEALNISIDHLTEVQKTYLSQA